MPRHSSETLMTALGFPEDLDRLYHRVLPQTGRELALVATTMGRTPEELLAALDPLVRHGIVGVEDARLHVADPSRVVALMLAETAESARRAHGRLTDVAAALPFLTERSAGTGEDEAAGRRPLDGELTSGGDPVALLEALLGQTTGDLLWLRPDRFQRPREEAMLAMVAEAIAGGRRSRAIYPVRALGEARATLAARAAAGEQIRVLPEVPTRLLVIGTSHAILPEPLGFVDEPRSLVRQRGLVELAVLWFESLWDRAAPVPSMERGDSGTDLRRFLLQQLAAGAQDEQIARRLGVSLRTVRRRVADLLHELGADSRFQAGVEAVRRGWL